MTPPAAGAARTTVFRNVRPVGGGWQATGTDVKPVDLAVVDGRIAERPVGAYETVECGGRLALPTPVDAHIHPDKTAWGEKWFSRRPADGIADYCEQDVELNRRLATPVGERSRRLMAHAAAQGTRGMRVHGDVAPAYGLEAVEGLHAAREALSHLLHVQITGFPQHGVNRAPGTDKLLERAAREGLIDYVGGIDPAGFDNAGETGGDSVKAQLDTVFGIAERHRLGVDIHLHDQGETGLGPLREIIARTRALDMAGKVTVSHAFCVPALKGREFDRTAADLAEAGISLTTVAPDAQRVLPLKELAEHGVRVGVGSDGVRDSWSPYGNGDMLYRAHLLGFCLDARLDEELARCYLTAAHGGAELLGLPAADLSVGAPADFLLVEGECLPQVVVDMPRRDMVVRAGRIVAREGKLV
ncbi:amidohydrolase [Streptomyces sp. ODS28]|uniref:amidohydrolase n=1 Tax=Streptomyces sp. ODS28 TaxID=3136688 RepID=UPI0031ECFCAA